MSYKDINQTDFLDDLLRRKEFYSLKGTPDDNFRDPPNQVTDQLTGKYLRVSSHQLFVRNIMNPNTPYKRLHLKHDCHPAGTSVLLSDGASIYVECVRVGDVLASANGGLSVVTSLSNGVEECFQLECVSGDSLECNRSHILSVIHDDDESATVIDMRLSDLIACPDINKYSLFTGGHPFKATEIPVDPREVGRRLRKGIHPLIRKNSYMIRFRFLMGVFDAFGRRLGDSYLVTHIAHRELVLLARSLGLGATSVGDTAIINLSPHRRSRSLKFTVKSIGEKEYYGFSLEGDPHYLLSNFIVTHNTGVGKTIAALEIASEFIKVYSTLYSDLALKIGSLKRNQPELDKNTPNVFVLGFGGTKTAFTRDLMRYPEFGYITHDELTELNRRRAVAASTTLQADIDTAKNYYITLKKRLTNKARGGFFRFYGYDEFINRLFYGEVKLTELEQELTGTQILEDVLREKIASGEIRVNEQFLASMKDSLIICDEIHNTYNTGMKNNRGVALQYAIDNVPSMRVLTMSATPINNSPSEIVELLNYMLHEKVTKKEFFTGHRDLLPGALERIGKLSAGYFSFLQDANPKYFPSRSFEGEPYIMPVATESLNAGVAIPYLKFVQCKMSRLHQATLTKILKEHKDTTNDEENIGVHESYTIPTDSYAINDIAFPNYESEEFGLVRTSEVAAKLAAAPQNWRDAHGVEVRKQGSIGNIVTGAFLRKDKIGEYSSKLATMLELIMKIIASANGDVNSTQKIMIYHNRLRPSGVLLIQECLKQNDIVDEYTEPTENTICAACGGRMFGHTEQHKFIAARFAIAHSEVDKSVMEQSLTKYNAPENALGHKIQILLGSRIIKESYDIKDVRHMIIMSLPVNIPTLIQVLGRCIRKGSHINLPQDRRHVSISILLSVVDTSNPHSDALSPEAYRYALKVRDYEVIQRIERELHRFAIDAPVHRDIVMPPNLYKQFFPPGAKDPVGSLGNLYFDSGYPIPSWRIEELNNLTFRARDYHIEEVSTISLIIKRLFALEPVWTYDSLWKAVRAPPFGLEVNPRLFDELNYIIALSSLADNSQPIVAASDKEPDRANIVTRMLNKEDKFVYIGATAHRIIHVGQYYAAFPLKEETKNTLNDQYAEFVERIRDRERLLISSMSVHASGAYIDAETYLRTDRADKFIEASVSDFVTDTKVELSFGSTFKKFTRKYEEKEDLTFVLLDYSSKFQAKLLEFSIESILSGKKAAIHSRIVAFYSRFGAVLFAGEVAKYKDIVKQFATDIGSIGEDVAIGILSLNAIRLIDPVEGNYRWFEVSRVALNRAVTYKEKLHIVGYIEDAIDHTKFKIRKSVDEIKRTTNERARRNAQSAIDTRSIERGIVCSTKTKKELTTIAADIGISLAKHKIKNICRAIFRRFIELEEKERRADTRYKYLYGWWDELVDLSLLV